MVHVTVTPFSQLFSFPSPGFYHSCLCEQGWISKALYSLFSRFGVKGTDHVSISMAGEIRVRGGQEDRHTICVQNLVAYSFFNFVPKLYWVRRLED